MTVRLRCSPADLVRVRFAISPMWETNAAVRLLTRGRPGSPHAGWLRGARERAAGLDLGALTCLMPARGYTPDFLSPPPAGPDTTFDHQLVRVRQTPPAQVRTELDRSLARSPVLPPGADWLDGDPATARDRLSDSLAAAWETLVRPAWSATRDVLEADVAYHSRRSSRDGVRSLFLGLDDRVSWSDRDGLLAVDNRVDEERSLDGDGLVLMPSSFVWPDIVVVTDRPWRATLVYPARGIAGLWRADPGPDRATALSRLLGARRAAILHVTGTPTTTTRLARSMSLSPATVSEHLGVLRDAGLVTGRRVGRAVEYERTVRGDALVEA